MRSVYILFVILGFSAILGCSNRQYTDGKYDDPNKVILLDDKFSENDLQLIANKLVESLGHHATDAKYDGKPVVMIGRVRNHTSEHIDVKSLTDKIRTELIKAQKYRFASKEARNELSEEYDYEASGYVNPETQKVKGKQIGIDYLITGDIASIVQQAGKQKQIYYKVTLNLIDLETNIIEWTDDREIRKRYKKKSVGF
jgi:uncharacterized protein (TIGR02722 family)